MKIRRLQINNKVLETTLFLTYNFFGIEEKIRARPWEYDEFYEEFGYLHILFSLKDLLNKKGSLKLIHNLSDLNMKLDKTIIMLDTDLRSLKWAHDMNTDLLIKKILAIITILKPDICVIPYFRILTKDPPNTKEYLLEKNLKLMKAFLEFLKHSKDYTESFTFSPCLQVPVTYSEKNKVDIILSKYRNIIANFDWIKMLSYGSHMGWPLPDMIEDTYISYKIRKEFGDDYFIHALGIGRASIFALVNAVGIDSGDCVSWSKTGGYGKILPNPFEGEKRVCEKTMSSITMIKKVPHIDWNKFKCNCPFCRNKSLSEIKSMFAKVCEKKEYLKSPLSVPLRIHNAWMTLMGVKEIKNLLTSCSKAEYKTFIRKIGSIHNHYKKAAEFILKTVLL